MPLLTPCSPSPAKWKKIQSVSLMPPTPRAEAGWMKPWLHANPFCDGNLESSRRILPTRALPAQCLDFPLEEPRRESDLRVHRKEPDEHRTNYEIYPATADRG